MFRNKLCVLLVLAFCSLAYGQDMKYKALLVGINDYPDVYNDLKWCVDDAVDMSYALKNYQGWLEENINPVFNSDATILGLYGEFGKYRGKTGETNLFHFSGHGSEDIGLFLADERCITPYMLEYDLNYNNINQYCAILDACFSGQFANGMNSGVILAACTEDEVAMEDSLLENGVFSYYLVEGLTNNTADQNSDGLLSAEELFAYASPMVTAYCDSMHPQIGDNYSGGLMLNYNIYVPQQYSSLSAALSASRSGQTVVVSSGSQTVSSNLTVPSGVKLLVKPSVTITFNSGTKLTVNGTLTTEGTAASPVTFNFVSPNSTTQNGIIFNSGSSGVINYCKIRNAYRGIYENSTSVNITNSAISGCTDGIYLYCSSPVIEGCNIHDNGDDGINLVYSSPTIKENYIQNNLNGIFCSYGSTAVIGNNSTQKGNSIINNSYGIILFGNANPVVGNSSIGGYNNFTNISNNIINTTGNTILARNNWWGTTNPQVQGGISYIPYLTSSVGIAQPSLSKTGVSAGKEEIPLLSELDKVYELIASKNLSAARGICLDLINNYPGYSVSYNALNLLKETYTADEEVAKKNVYKSLFSKKSRNDLQAMAGLMLADLDKENKLARLDEVIEAYKGESVVELALFNKFLYYYFEKEDMEKARETSDELDKQFELSLGAIEAHKILGDEKYFGVAAKTRNKIQMVNEEITDFTLFENYPNPFNPTTTISYQLPEAGFVTLKVFDMLGREVANLVNKKMEAGKYSVNFNASNLASGIYIYRITIQSFEGSKDFFTQSNKMLLLK